MNATLAIKIVTIKDSIIIVDTSGSEYKRQVLNTAMNEIAITDTRRSPAPPKNIRQTNFIFAIISS